MIKESTQQKIDFLLRIIADKANWSKHSDYGEYGQYWYLTWEYDSIDPQELAEEILDEQKGE